MSLQPLFRKFEETIKLARFDENAELREKRDRVLKRMRESMPVTFEPFNQGSYAMNTGIKPLNGDYDIDIGVVLNIDRSQYDPVMVKGWVYKAVQEHTASVEWRRPCITVNYMQGGKIIYHVDLAIFAKAPYGSALYLAVGKEHSAKEQRLWQEDDRKGFIEAIDRRFSGEDAAQFRRVIRYLKRWKDVHFASEGRAAPTGLGLTLAAYYWFQPNKSTPYWGADSTYDDLGATISLVQAIRQKFGPVWDPSLGKHVYRISLSFPFAPRDDVFERMTNQQAQELYQRLGKLAEWLEDARRDQKPDSLRKAFGNDFPDK